jgi:hypothetical protein
MPRTALRLSEKELESVRAASLVTLAETRLPAVIAIAETGAVSTEIGEVRVCDVDSANHRVWLGGCHTALPRWGQLSPGQLSPWGEDQLSRRIVSLALPPTALLVSTGASRDIRQKSVHVALTACFQRAGVKRRPGVKAGSIRALAGWRAFLTRGRIEDTAKLLGCTSLDSAAATIGLVWNDEADDG